MPSLAPATAFLRAGRSRRPLKPGDGLIYRNQVASLSEHTSRMIGVHIGRLGRRRRPVESNLHVPVRLTLRDARGKEVRKEVSYVVSTSPHLAVYRELR